MVSLTWERRGDLALDRSDRVGHSRDMTRLAHNELPGARHNPRTPETGLGRPTRSRPALAASSSQSRPTRDKARSTKGSPHETEKIARQATAVLGMKVSG